MELKVPKQKCKPVGQAVPHSKNLAEGVSSINQSVVVRPIRSVIATWVYHTCQS